MIKIKLLLLIAILGLSSTIKAQSTNITFIVKDENTGFAVPGAVVQVTAPNGQSSTLTAAANGKLTFTAVNGKYDFSIAANGYKPLATYFSSGAETNIEARINLEPADNNARVQSFPKIRTNPNNTVVSGYVRDDAANSPLEGVVVSSGAASAITDSRGYFSLEIAVAARTISPAVAPEHATLTFTKSGHVSKTIENVYLLPDSYTMKVALSTAGAARQQSGQQPKGEIEKRVHGLFDRTEAEEQQRYAPVSTPQARAEAVLAATVPSSIRVGTSCSCTSCSVVNVMSLEAYAQSGLDDEWIASWGAASLQAGAVAYRTYGAWYVLHPVASSYDIAATTCNQAWEADTYTASVNAAKATAGIVLVKSGAIFRAEYSAENNNSGCGNGYSGTGTSSGWPCISDARCTGYAKNGHGRGMCQWGSSRWASDKTYTWILNHYYNPGSVTIQLPPTPALTVMSFAVKDQNTGLAIASAAVSITKPDGTTSAATTDANGKLVYGLNAGKYTFAFSKSGYKALSTFFTGGPDDSVYADINLDVAGTARTATTPLLTNAGNNMVLTGYVRDADLNKALGGVQITAGNYTATTNAGGFFSLTVPANAIKPGITPATISIQSVKTGYLTNSIQTMYVIPDTYEMQIALTSTASLPRARGITALRGNEELIVRRHGLFDKTIAEQQEFSAHPVHTNAREEATTLAALAVPTVVRVATSCACTACSSPRVQVMTLESYVQTGVDDEWVSSWNAASLQAGTVAYRSRGAWFVQHPVASNYDLSAAACHQTWQTDRTTSVKNAAIATAGIVLVKNGAIYKAEYCAESNNSGCGDGYSGTGTDYPCIADARCAGRTKSGAGRGMCQWGSSFWGTDQTYTWILDHYYNPDSAAIQTSTLVTTNSDSKLTDDRSLKVAPNPATGSSITIEYTLADASQPASIVVTDNFGQQAKQRNVVLQPGINRLSVSTGGLKAGVYNVTVRLATSGKAVSRKVLIVK